MSGRVLRLGVVLATVAVLAMAPLATLAQEPLENREYLRRMAGAQVRDPSDDPVADYDARIDAVENLTPHNEQQYRLQQLNLMWLNWHRANELCIAMYKSAENVADVGRWLACVTPVNAAIQVLATEIRDQQIAMVQDAQQPDPGYSAPPGRFDGGLQIAHGDDYATVVETIQQVEEALEEVIDARDTLKALASDGGPRQMVTNLVAADGTKVTIAVGELQLGFTDEGFTLQSDPAAIVNGLVDMAEAGGQPPESVEVEIGISQEHGDATLALAATERLQVALGPAAP